MSVSTGMFTAAAMFLAIGGDTEKAMRLDTWEMAGLCHRHTCEWTDPLSRDCQARIERRLPCKIDHAAAKLNAWKIWPRSDKPQPGWHEFVGAARECTRDDTWQSKCIREGYLNTLMWRPQWVPADQPTAHGWNGYWWKLRL